MGDFDATLAGNEQNFRTTIVTLDPLLTQLNGTLGLVYADTQSSIAAINTNNRCSSPSWSARLPDRRAGNNLLRHTSSSTPLRPGQRTPNPQCQSGTGQAPPAARRRRRCHRCPASRCPNASHPSPRRGQPRPSRRCPAHRSPARSPVGALYAGGAAHAEAAGTHTEPVAVPITAGRLPAAGHAARLADALALTGTA